jgi:2-polyprenyl-3-methyl-5-hydroxy-6-metoxy-1,4-benzoquinol methylase
VHYIIDDYVIESELAAKSTIQTNKDVLDYIYSLPKAYRVLDYGCGKLRYSIVLAENVTEVVAIDSDYQLHKQQIINGIKTSVSNYAQVYTNNVRTYSINSDSWKSEKYDAVFCINVLSAIPDDCDRHQVLKNAKSVLSGTGRLLIAVQNRNSYFKHYPYREHTIRHNDGWLIHRVGNKYSFYGILSEEKLVHLCFQSGLEVRKIFRNNGSVYLEAF